MRYNLLKKSFVAILVVHEIENKRKFFRFDILPSLKYFFRKMHFQSVFPPLQKYCFNCCQRVLRCFRFFLIISGWFFLKIKYKTNTLMRHTSRFDTSDSYIFKYLMIFMSGTNKLINTLAYQLNHKFIFGGKF